MTWKIIMGLAALLLAPATMAMSMPAPAQGSGDPITLALQETPITDEATAAATVPVMVSVTLERQSGVTGTQRVNFALPMEPGLMTGNGVVRVRAGTAELRAGTRVIARWGDGSIRSLQIQADVPSTATALELDLGTAPTTPPLALVDVSTTLLLDDGTTGPKVWVFPPTGWLSNSYVVGPMRGRNNVAGTRLDAFQSICDYSRFDVDAFLMEQPESNAEFWLYDRATAQYRGYVYAGSKTAFRSAFREAAIYRAGITGSGSSTRIGVPDKSNDAKYHYAQGMAIHYLLTGDDRFREDAENVAIRMHDLWDDPPTPVTRPATSGPSATRASRCWRTSGRRRSPTIN
jgi:hypothetical protein